MGKITFRADDDLVAELEAFEASKSEVMREALRRYLEAEQTPRGHGDERVGSSSSSLPSSPPVGYGRRVPPTSIDELVCARVDERLDQRLAHRERERERERERARARKHEHEHEHERERESEPTAQDVNVTISLEGLSEAVSEGQVQPQTETVSESENRESESARERKTPERDHTQQPSDNRAPSDTRQCDGCGNELDSDHVFCPNCGEKASRRAFCECGDELRSDWAFCPGCGRRTPAAGVLDSN